MSDWGWPGLIAHRCGGALAPENTLAGLGVAARLGCVAVEFDAMLSADGVPLLMHDETLDRTAGVPGCVAAMPAAALLATDVGGVFHPAFRGETIPRLIDALARCRALGFAANLEIKPATGVEIETGRVVGELLASMAPEERPVLLLSSFSADALRIAAGWRARDSPRVSRRSLRRCGHRHRAGPWLPVPQPLPARAFGRACGGREEGRSALSCVHRQSARRSPPVRRVGRGWRVFRPSRSIASGFSLPESGLIGLDPVGLTRWQHRP